MSEQSLVSAALMSTALFRRQQRGAVLIVALVMLLVMTTLGVSTITSTNITLQLVQSQ